MISSLSPDINFASKSKIKSANTNNQNRIMNNFNFLFPICNLIKDIALPSAVIAVVMSIVLVSPACKSMSPLRGDVFSAARSAVFSFCPAERSLKSCSESPCRGRRLFLEERDDSHVNAVTTNGGAGTIRFLREVLPYSPRWTALASP